MKSYLPAVLLICLSGCGPSRVPINSTEPRNNKSFKVDYLFEHDGCKVYRFYDYGYVYFTTCNGEAIVKRDSCSDIRNVTVVKKQ